VSFIAFFSNKMAQNRIAVGDLGTNIFRLLVVDVQPDNRSFETVYRAHEAVYLAANGITNIGNAPMTRAKNVLRQFAQKIAEYGVVNYRICGTAALRTAKNGAELVAWARTELNLVLTVIDGDEEAALIGAGIRWAYPIAAPTLLMDIGGGSTEFIISDGAKNLWAQSFPIGVTVLYEQFQADGQPLSPQQVDTINSFLDIILTPLRAALREYNISNLAATAGTFSVLTRILRYPQTLETYTRMPYSDYQKLHSELVYLPYNQLLAHPDIPEHRAQLLPISLVLINYAAQLVTTDTIILPHYAMKEGILWQLIHASA
jgi:exopolyphosphatase / guanosine-5'-triphosphate,3'-diphosphate pyrophosphatase